MAVPGTRARMPSLEPIAQRGQRRRASIVSLRDARSRAATPMPAMAGTFSVPARRLRSCLPPVMIGASRTPRRIQSAPAPFGPWNLCAESESRSTPSARTSTGILPTDCTASVWNSAPCAWAMRGDLRDRLNRADLVVGVHHRDERRVVGERLASALGGDDAAGIDRQQRDVQPRRASALSVLSTASCSMRARDQMPAARRLERFGGAADARSCPPRCRRW